MMKFEIGKFYKTRDGRKAQVFMLSNGNNRMLGAVLYSWKVWEVTHWNQQGCEGTGSEYPWDLVAEWREPIKYSVELWGTAFAPVPDTTDLQHFVFGYIGTWREEPDPKCPIKYRVTVEEIVEGEGR
jgi:hypothetical protein